MNTIEASKHIHNSLKEILKMQMGERMKQNGLRPKPEIETIINNGEKPRDGKPRKANKNYR